MDVRSGLMTLLQFILAWIAGALLSLPALTTIMVVLSDSPGYPYVRDSAISQAAILAIIVATIVGVLLIRGELSLKILWKFAIIALVFYWIAISIIDTTLWPSTYVENSIVIKSYVLATGIASYLIANHYSFKKLENEVRA